jgi:hypothetical protein
MRLILGGGYCVFGILGENGQIGQLLGESLSHDFLDRHLRAKPAPMAQRIGSETFARCYPGSCRRARRQASLLATTASRLFDFD